MAHGRMVSKKISLNKTVNSMSDRSQLAFTWAIAHLDYNGVIHGDPAVFKMIVFPRRKDITEDEIEHFINEWNELGLIIIYEAVDDIWLHFPGFDRNQVGLRKDRERASGYPLPGQGNIIAGGLPEDCRKTAGELPQSSRGKLREVKLSKDKITSVQKDARVKHLIDFYFQKYQERTDRKANVTGAWGKGFQRLLKNNTEEEIQAVIDFFFAYPKRTQFAFTTFMGKYDNLAPLALESMKRVQKGEVTWKEVSMEEAKQYMN